MESIQGSDVRNLSWGETDHLAYLKNRSLFEEDHPEATGGTVLVCGSCGNAVTNVSEKIEVFGRHDHAFPYYREIVRLGCFRNARGCLGVQGVSHGYSWFRGYAWRIQVCRSCYAQLGWKYISPEDSFYGLVFGMLREAESREENG